MSKEESYAKLSFSACFAGAVGSLLTYLVGEYPDDRFWRGFMYCIPPITLASYKVTSFIEVSVKEWWDARAEKADVEFIVKECDSIIKDNSVAEEHKAEAIEARSNAKMSPLKNRVQRLKKHEIVDSAKQSSNGKRNRAAAGKV